MSDAYAGAQDADSDATDLSAHEFIIDRLINRRQHAAVVQVMTAPYDANGNPITPGSPVPIGFVDVHPLTNQLDGYGNAYPHGTIFRLKYHRYQGGNGAFITDPVVGDQGKMVVADTDTSSVRATNAQANPGSRRRNDMADGTYFGCVQGAAAPTQWFAWLDKGFNMTDAYGNTIVGTADGVVINGATITLSGDVITKQGISLDNHVHGGVEPGSGDTGPPVAEGGGGGP